MNHVSAVGSYVLRKGLACVFNLHQAFVLLVKNNDKPAARARKIIGSEWSEPY